MESLHRLAEAVRGAGADIAPTYQEYMQLAFAVANDCGEAGRADFLALCSPSPKYDRQAADKLFSNALKNGRNDIHLGTAFHLARLCGVEVQPPPTGTMGTLGTGGFSASHTHARTRGNNGEDEKRGGGSGGAEEDTFEGSDPLTPLPTFDPHLRWPLLLERIMECGTSRSQRDVLLLGAITALGASMGNHVRCSYGGKMISPCLQSFVVDCP